MVGVHRCKFLTRWCRASSFVGKRGFSSTSSFLNVAPVSDVWETLAPQQLTYPSHSKGVVHPPLREQLFSSLFAEQADKYGSSEFFYWHETKQRVSWQEYYSESAQLATGLMRLGYEPGDRLGIWLPNCYDWLRMQLACALIGVISVNVNPAYRLDELKHAMNLVGLKGIIILPELKTSNYLNIINQLCPELETMADNPSERLHVEAVPDLHHIFMCESKPSHRGIIDVAKLVVPQKEIDWAGIASIERELSVFDPINIQFTSGTTGRPKAATLTHHNIINNAQFIANTMAFTEKDKLCLPVPMYHCFGDVLGFLACATTGASMVFPSKVFNPLDALTAVAQERCTALHGVPTMFIAELGLPNFKSFDLSSLRTGIMAGSPCPVEVMKRVINEMHCKDMTIAYGMTETSPVSFQTNIDDTIERRVETIGVVHPHLEVKIVDQQGNTVPIGMSGELCTKGYAVMKGYWGQPDKTAESIDADGFMHTGDILFMDDEGYCRVDGRASDMIIRGGENIYPLEVENALYLHNAIKDVSVVGVPDDYYGEQVCAYVTLHNGETVTRDSLREFARSRISHFKIPHYVSVVDEFPLTVTGKVQKFKLREMFDPEQSIL